MYVCVCFLHLSISVSVFGLKRKHFVCGEDVSGKGTCMRFQSSDFQFRAVCVFRVGFGRGANSVETPSLFFNLDAQASLSSGKSNKKNRS